MNALYQSHIGSWAILVILFFISYFLIRGGKERAGKIIHMIVRLFYIIMIVSGVGLLFGYKFPLVYVVKGIIAIILIYAMEMLLVRTAKGTIGSKAPTYWTTLIISLIVVLLLGFNVITF